MALRWTDADAKRFLALPAPRHRKPAAHVGGFPCTAPVVLVLPYPPLNNRYYRHVGSQVLLSRAGRQYRAAVAQVVQATWPRDVARPFHSRLTCTLVASAPYHNRYDLDGIPKGVLDALQYAGVYLNDAQIDRLVLERGPWSRTEGTLSVTLEPYAPRTSNDQPSL